MGIRWWRKLRDAGSVATLIQMAADIYKGTRAKFTSIAGGIMSWFVDFITNMPDWLEVALVGVVLFVAFTKYEHWSKGREPEKQKDESERQLSGITAECNKYKEEAQQKEAELEKLKEQLEIEKSAANVFEGQCDEYKRQAEDKDEGLVELREKFKRLQREHGRWFLQWHGSQVTPMNLSVVVQFIEPHDSNLAKQISDEFFSLGGVWNRKPIEQIKWFQNPSSSARIVIFSDHVYADGIRGAFNECCLLGEEKVGLYSKEPHMQEDVTIIVFNKDN